MRAALLGVDVVDEAVDILLIAVVVLHGDLDNGVVLHAVEVDRLLAQGLFLAVEVGDEGANTAVEMEGLAPLRLAALVDKGDCNAVVEKGKLAQTVFQRLEAVGGDGKDLGIRDEVDACPRRL